jgi:hypothetical protein
MPFEFERAQKAPRLKVATTSTCRGAKCAWNLAYHAVKSFQGCSRARPQGDRLVASSHFPRPTRPPGKAKRHKERKGKGKRNGGPAVPCAWGERRPAVPFLFVGVVGAAGWPCCWPCRCFGLNFQPGDLCPVFLKKIANDPQRDRGTYARFSARKRPLTYTALTINSSEQLAHTG